MVWPTIHNVKIHLSTKHVILALDCYGKSSPCPHYNNLQEERDKNLSKRSLATILLKFFGCFSTPLSQETNRNCKLFGCGYVFISIHTTLEIVLLDLQEVWRQNEES